jgi:iron complex outermembrane receptor protein
MTNWSSARRATRGIARRLIVAAVTLLLVPALRADASLHGTVRDATGAAIADAHIAATRPAGAAPCETTSAADGTFTLDCVSPPAVVRVEALGFKAVELTARDSLHVVLMPVAYTEAVVVTASRAEGVTTSGAAPVSVLTSSDLALLPPAPLDDALKSVPGFSLFRRTTSRAANPTTQGAGMRGLSASGASRALVLADGVPLNDPFGGWVYWSRVPAAAVDRVEVMRGSGSDLYGADAMAGVVQVLTRKPGDASLKVDLEGASHGTGRASLFAGGSRGPWRGTASGEAFTTDGYILVPEDQRGPVDLPATQRYDSGRVGVGYETPGFYARVTGDVYAEHRGNGTPIQTNSTDIRQLHLDLGGTVAGGSWNVTGQTGDQSYDQAFSSIATDRSSETLTSRQYVPAVQHGFAARWQRGWEGVDVLAGADTRDVSATNNEQTFAPSGTPRPATHTGAYQRTSGAYLQFTVRPASNVTATVGARGDLRQPSRDVGFFDGDSAFSPRASVTWTASSLVVVRGSVGWAFRAPTLNERYRGFRVGNVITLPNADLAPESLRTIEGGLLFTPRRGALRITVYQNDLDDAVTNVTLTSTPELITRQRMNVGSIHVLGAEVEGEWRLSPALSLIGSSAFTHSRFADYAPLEGLTTPQVPGWTGTIGIRGAAPGRLALSAQIRAFGSQFEDDRNTIVLNSGSVADVTILRPIGHLASAYISFENIFDVDYDVGRTPVRTTGQPFTLHGGVHLTLGK